MNEQIQELSAIAKNLTTDEAIHLSRIHNRTLSLDELGEIHDQKFAELIVQECKENFAKVWYEQGLDIRGAELGKFLTRFEEHFGVEE